VLTTSDDKHLSWHCAAYLQRAYMQTSAVGGLRRSMLMRCGRGITLLTARRLYIRTEMKLRSKMSCKPHSAPTSVLLYIKMGVLTLM
jgi:hypothetical protein